MNRRVRQKGSADPHAEAARRAAALFQAGRLGECEAACRQITARDPGHGEANLLLGLLALSAGRRDAAITHLQTSLKRNAKNPFAHGNLGVALSEEGRLDEAARALETATKLKPDYVEAYSNLGGVEAKRGRDDKALRLYVKALSLNPANHAVRANYANALLRQGDLAAAAENYRKVVAAKPDHAEAHYGLGQTLRDLGELDDAKTHLLKADELAHPHANAMLSWAWIADEAGDDTVAGLREAQQQAPDGSQDRMLLSFALGKIENDRGEYEHAARHLGEANRLRRAELTYDRAQTEAEFAEIMETFDAKFFADREGYGADDDRAIFVLGMPRSGTSLIEQILASHPQVHGAGELTDLRDVAGLTGDKPSARSFPDMARSVSRGMSATLGKNYMKRLRAHAPDAARITDKMPGNFVLIGFIRMILPKATIIHCTRDPRDTCLSIFRTNFTTGGLGFAYDMDDLVHYYGLYEKLMAHWNAMLGDTIIEANNEALLKNPEGEIRTLLERCGLGFAPQCLEFHKTERAVRTASAAQVRRPLYDSSKRGWRAYEPYFPELARLAR